MKLFKLLLVISLFTNYYSYSNPVSVENTDYGCKVTISNLKYKLIKTNTGSYKAMLENFPETSWTSQNSLATEELLLQFAVPSENTTIKINKITRKFIGENIKLSTLNEIEPPSKIKMRNDIKKINTIQSNTQLNIDAYIESYASQRNVKIAMLAIQPFEYSEKSKIISAMDTLEFELIYSPKCIISSFFLLPKKLRTLYTSIENPDILPDLIKSGEIVSKKKTDKIQTANSWYQNNKTYIKIVTHKDGAAYVNGSEIINLVPDWNNADLSKFNLYYLGKSYPFTFLGNSTGQLSPDIQLIFFGRHVPGDSTFYDFYTNDAVFYLTYNDGSNQIMLKNFPAAGTNLTDINSVTNSRHYEKDSLYSLGANSIITETSNCEGWLWNTIYYGSSPFKYYFSIPTITSDSVKMMFDLKSIQFDIDSLGSQNHKVSIAINDNIIDTVILLGGKEKFYKNSYPKEYYLNGLNLLTITDIGLFDFWNNLIKPEMVGIDNFEITTNGSSFTENDYYNANVSNSQNDGKLTISGFDSDTVYVFDTTKNYLSIIKAQNNGSLIRVAAQNQNSPFASIVLNDSIIFGNEENGVFIAAAYPPLYDSIQKNKYPVANSDAANFINSMPKNTIFALAYNSNGSISGEFKNAILSLGSKLSSSITEGKPYVIGGIKGLKIDEKLASNVEPVSLTEFFNHPEGVLYSIQIPLKTDSSPYDLVFSGINNIEHAGVFTVEPSNLLDVGNSADMVVVSHHDFLESATAYANYRSQTDSLKIEVIDVENIYKEFNYGKKSPHAIKSFLQYAIGNWKDKPVYVLLYGDASWDSKKLLSFSVNTDYIPSYGLPVSDFWYAQLDGNDFIPDIIHGRIPINSNQQGHDYLNKIKEYDSNPNFPWMKDILLLSGGYNDYEINQFYEYIKLIGSYIVDTHVCGDTTMIHRNNTVNGVQLEAVQIIKKINEGQFCTMFLGHGSPLVFDMDGWSSDKLSNKGRYGFLSTLACNTSAFAEPDIQSRNEDYILTPNKGFIAAGGSSGVGFPDIDANMAVKLFRFLSDPTSKFNTYTCLIDAVREISNSDPDEQVESTQYIYLGDPLLKYRFSKNPDFYMMKNEITLSNDSSKAENSIVFENDSKVYISGTVYNVSLEYQRPVKLLLIRNYKNIKDSLYYYFDGICNNEFFRFQLLVQNMPGIHNITLIIDPDSLTGDYNYNNNTYTFQLNVFKKGLLPLDPLDFWQVSAVNPYFRVINPYAINNISYKFNISSTFSDSLPVSIQSKDNEINVKENYIEWKPNITLDTNKQYVFSAKYILNDSSQESKTIDIPFYASNMPLNEINLNISSDFLQYCSIVDFTFINNNRNKYFEIKTDTIPYNIESCRGTYTYERSGEIDFNDTNYYTSPPEIVGFHIVDIDGNGLFFKTARFYDTWGPYDVTNDSVSIFMNQFLRDTVPLGDYIELIVVGASYRVLEAHNAFKDVGSLDTLRKILRENYGSVLADSIDDPYSFAMLGRKGAAPGTIHEMSRADADTAKVKGVLFRKHKIASFQTLLIGPAKKWEGIVLSGIFPDSSVQYNLKIYGYDNSQSNETELLSLTSTSPIDLSNLDAMKYPFIRLFLSVNLSSNSVNPELAGINFKFIPAPEFAVIKSKCLFDNDSIMRGETDNFQFSLENISGRINSDSSNVDFKIYSSSSSFVDSIINIEPLTPSASKTIKISDISTDNFSNLNNVSVETNYLNTNNEIYGFNNNFLTILNVFEDTEKPTIKFYIDGREVKNFDYVQKLPILTAELYDNSKLPVPTDAYHKLRIRKNSIMMNESNTISYNYESFGRNTTLKARLTIAPDSLDIGENVFTIYGQDATGNIADTLVFIVQVSQNSYIQNIKVSPNPLDNSTVISFDYLAQMSGGRAILSIFDITGNLIKNMELIPIVGANLQSNTFSWDTRDNFGSSIPSGVYIYMIKTESEFWAEPKFGKLLIIH